MKAKSNGHNLSLSFSFHASLLNQERQGQRTGHISAILICLLQYLIRDDQALGKAGKVGHSSKLWFLFLFLLSW